VLADAGGGEMTDKDQIKEMRDILDSQGHTALELHRKDTGHNCYGAHWCSDWDDMFICEQCVEWQCCSCQAHELHTMRELLVECEGQLRCDYGWSLVKDKENCRCSGCELYQRIRKINE